MRIDQLIFVGLRGYVIALERDSGQIVWDNSELASGYTSLLLDGDRLIVSTNGYIYCLDPLTGQVLWNNPLRGYGVGIADLASVRGQSARRRFGRRPRPRRLPAASRITTVLERDVRR